MPIPVDYGMGPKSSSSSMATIGEAKYRVNVELTSSCKELDEVYNLLEDSYNEMQNLRKALEDDRWMGESKEAFMLLLEAISQFHLLLKDGLAQNKYALDSLDNMVESYLKDSTIASLLEV